MAMAMAMATTCSSNLSPFKLFFNSSPITRLRPPSLTLKRTTSLNFSSSSSSAALKKCLQPARTAAAAGTTAEHGFESEMGETEETEMVEMGGELFYMEDDDDEDEDSFRTSAVPKKRTSKMKKRIRKNCWKRKAAVAAAKALSLAKSIATGKSTSFMVPPKS